MSERTLLDKVWRLHTVRSLDNGVTQLLIGMHLVHEVTSPQAFAMLRARGLKARFPKRTFATADHIIPTDNLARPFGDKLAEEMMAAITDNCRDFEIEFLGGEKQGIVHIIGPEMGLTQPGLTIACGDSHTATHGAFGAVAFGIGTTQVANALGSGCILAKKPKVRRIQISGKLQPGVYAKDVTLYVIHLLGVAGGTGFAYEYAGDTIDDMSMEERMTICNMSIEGGAIVGYCLPDMTTVEYLRTRERVPQDGSTFQKLANWWMTLRSDADAVYDDVVTIKAEEIPPMITWGTDPGQSTPVTGKVPLEAPTQALTYTGLSPDQPILGLPIDVAFLGSCTNGRIGDLRIAAGLIQKHNLKVAPGVRAIVVPGSFQVAKQAVTEGLNKVFTSAGFEWRSFGCSACLGMNPDTFKPGERAVSSSNRNFEGRQGQGVRTMLMSPAGVVISAAQGKVTDTREWLVT